MLNKQPETIIELSADLTFRDDAECYTSSIVIGLFKTEKECLRIMRVIRSNNPTITFKLQTITNPHYITKLMEDKNKIY